MNKKILTIIIIATLAIIGAGVYLSQEQSKGQKIDRKELKDEITLLYTGDVHCGVDKYIGYAGLVAYKNKVKQEKQNVVLIDCGDAIQGEYIGTLSSGDYIVDIMNECGYDLAICGNHEFDYGAGILNYLIKHSKAKYLNCNITYEGNKANALADTASYTVITYGQTKVGFVGVTTPATTHTSTPGFFMEDGKFVYDFKGYYRGRKLYETIQASVDDCLANGADYVVLIAHLGNSSSSYEDYSSTKVAVNTNGIDVILDSHSHSVIPYQILKNKDGNDVVLTSSGDKLKFIGRVDITPKGIKSELISAFGEKDQHMMQFIDGIKSAYEGNLKKVIGISNVKLSCYDDKYIRIVRNRETNIGDWITDAIRNAAKSDVAVFNGGSIRADIAVGDVTVGDINAVNGFNNQICMLKVTGQEILDLLEMSYRKTLPVITNDGKWSVGEDGGFLQVSGLKCVIDTSIHTPVETDENGIFERIKGQRRVQDVQIIQNGEYEPVDPNKIYTLASSEYLIKDSGDGLNFFAQKDLILDESLSVTQVCIEYFKSLNGDLSDYLKPQKRIVVK